MKTAFRTICLAATALIAVACGVTRPAAPSQPQPQSQPETPPQSSEDVVPAYLQKGDKIAIIAPAYTTPFENVLGAAEVIRSWGYEPIIGSKVQKLYAGKYAGTDKERASDLRWALENPEIKAIICTRGGYGTIRLIDLFQPEEFAANPKWLVGYSDITTLIEMENCAGVAAIHGTMGNTIAKGGEDATCQTLKSLLEGSIPEYLLPSHPQNRLGKATGILVGGNICTFAANLDTWADATARDGIILFIEEVEESMHHIDRLFNMLLMRGLLQRCRGIIFGEFTDCGSEFDFGSMEAMLNTYLEGYDIPVLCGFPAGHDKVNMPMVMGVPVSIDVRSDSATVSFDIPGTKNIVDLR
ncbi:MAG: LD-carboxypeptidase [Bacteroidales bacterium]|nr:LD-carboxypeptidase [Bacteroidales bacterium]